MDRAPHAQRLFQVGIALFLAAVLLGLFIPRFTVPRLALAAHLIGLLQGIFLVVIGLLWPRLDLVPLQSRLAFWLVVYQAMVAFLTNALAAIWGAGNSIVPMAAGAAHGSSAQEMILTVGLRTAGAALIVALVFMLWGLRRAPAA